MKVVVLFVNFIRSHRLNHRQFKFFLLETDAEYEDALYHTNVRWMNCGTALKYMFLALRLETEAFMNEKGKVLAEFGEEKWFWDLASVCDISHHLSDLNTKLQRKQKLVSDMFWCVRILEMKLELFRKQLGNINLCAIFFL
jgi:hypothetical protein